MMRAHLTETARLDRAVQIVLRGLAALPRSTPVLRLTDQAERLRADIKSWQGAPPSAAARERMTRATLAIHLETLRAAAFPSPVPPPAAPSRDDE